jgi:hypothetical protein
MGDSQDPVTANGELTAWKEIAAYLGVSVRTAQILEKEQDLPVRRMGGPRGRVSTTIAQLESWKRRNAVSASPEPSPAPAPRNPIAPTRPAWALWGAVFVVLVLGAIAARSRLAAGNPASWHLEHDSLVVVDQRGREVWRKVFPPLAGDAYRLHSSNLGWIGDLDGDSSNEVLFVPVPRESQSVSVPLICYSANGTELWRYATDRAVASGRGRFAAVYSTLGFAVTPIRQGQENGIVLVNNHNAYYPSQVALLSATGSILREYWHNGVFFLINLADLDNDSANEIYLAGINNPYRSATLVVLDVDRFGGAARDSERTEYNLIGLPPPVERARIILPRTCISRANDPWASIFRMWVRHDEIVVETNERLKNPLSILHHLSPDLNRHDAILGDAYRQEHRRLLQSGEIDEKSCPLEDPELKRVRRVAPDQHQKFK